MSTLHITNGDATVDLLNAAEFEGTFLPWRDILHMGPVHTHLPLTDLSEQRAEFISSQGWGDKSQILEDFRQRDNMLASCAEFDSIMLWFEHDLYDQLQLLQLLSWFDDHKEVLAKLTLINPDKHLGYHTPEEAKRLPEIGRPVNDEMTALAKDCWHLFGCSNLSEWAQLTQRDTSPLPHLHNAIMQSIDELPERATGLNRTEQRIMELIDQGNNQRGSLFRAYCNSEPAQFHGDMSFFWYMQQLIDDTPSLIDDDNATFSLTEMGESVLSGQQQWRREFSQDHWLGGCQLNAQVRTFWDNSQQRLMREE